MVVVVLDYEEAGPARELEQLEAPRGRHRHGRGELVVRRDVDAAEAAARRAIDRQGDQILEIALAELLEDGFLQRHVRKTRRLYEERRALLARLLDEQLGDALSFAWPSGGTAIWAATARGIAAERWASRALERGLVLQPGRQFAFDGRARPFLRLGFAQHDAREAREAVRRLVASRP
ncbi:aminotransferase class I/II-fold pyridoxal phosphate-dependent enzyme [bacterium]|nr:MAG: aminotransferase class I/II-fold pyridoxal phosphate-dependent enzyme [bacterium]